MGNGWDSKNSAPSFKKENKHHMSSDEHACSRTNLFHLMEGVDGMAMSP